MDPDSAESRSERLRSRVQRLGESQHALERYLAAGLSVDHPGLMVMNNLIANGPSTPTRLARLLDISPAAMTLVVQRLETAGHTTRSPHPVDRRKVLITADPDSRREAMTLVAPVIDGVRQIAATLSEAEQLIVEDFIDRLTDLYATVVEANTVPSGRVTGSRDDARETE